MLKNKEALFRLMKDGATVITPNNRLSNQLLQDFYLDCKTLIENKPHCLPYRTFLNNLFFKARHLYPNTQHPVLLNPIQQRHLWRELLDTEQNYPINEGLLHEIQDAWTRCHHWKISIDDFAFAQTPQTRQFQKWQQAFQSRLTALNLITEEQVIDYCSSFNNLFNLNSVVWVCFDDYTPEQRMLQEHFNTHDCQQYFYELPDKPLSTYRFSANDQNDEQLEMVRWLKSELLAGKTRIGVVIPDLQNQSSAFVRFLKKHLSQESFSLSLGKPLTDYALVTHALTWLQIDKKTISNHQARLLLSSPYVFGGKTELLVRSQILFESQSLQEAEIPFDTFLQVIKPYAPILAKKLDSIIEYPEHARPYEWIDFFKSRLTTLGFPGEYPLNSSTFQCFQRFMALFDELLKLSLFSTRITAKTALTALHDLSQLTIFQIRKATTRIQVLGLLEASGCTFDSVWVSGLTDQCLPQKTNLSAFIPIELQRTLFMPHSDSARELQFAQQVLTRLQNGSQHTVFSFPRLNGDMPNLPSPLIVNLPEFTPLRIGSEVQESLLIVYNEEYTQPMRKNEQISGGTSLLANQAKCPFRAFAAHRLHLKAEQELSTGLDASERGQIIHKIMEQVWQDIKTQQMLKTLPSQQLKSRITKAIDSALIPFIQNRPLSFPVMVQEIEQSRLNRIVSACLEWEKQRPPFEVEALEQTFIISLSDIEFKVRIDRLDRLASDEKWVIDYKTSIPTNKPWNEDRPEAPQLLLYALLDNSINALLFLQLKTGPLLFSGFSETTLSVKGVQSLKKNETWAAHRDTWHQQLTALASEISSGYCPPKPNRHTTCSFCEFKSLCRIHA